MKLETLIQSLDVTPVFGELSAEVTDLTDDSRRVTPGCGFIARAGSSDDGRRYRDDAIKRGATAVIEVPSDRPELVAELAERFFGQPAQQLRLIAVTGTNGKSTICFLVQHLLAATGVRCGLIGTVVIDDGQTRIPAELTTPGAIDFSRYLARMVANGCGAAVCEVSSHALDQGRTAGLRFDAAVFTNLTGDHLDYHKTMDAYGDAKAKLFESLDENAWAIVNRDDPHAERMVRDCEAHVLWTTLNAGEDDARVCRAAIAKLGADASGATFAGPWGAVEVTLPLVGRHNVCNALQAIAATHCVSPMKRGLRTALMDCPQVPGRLERVMMASDSSQPSVLVDYAHTHDSLENVLSTLQPITRDAGGQLICVFGCGGDRDKTKRPKMAAVACQFADHVIITSDNPRSEDPAAIIRDVQTGVPGDQSVVVIEDRAAAIVQAINLAQPNDTVLLAGKGHEDYQIIADVNSPGGTRKIHFDDREHAEKALKNKAKMKASAS